MSTPPSSNRPTPVAKTTDLQWLLAASGGTIATLGLAANADASLVQITQSGNFVSASDAEAASAQLDTDLTGDGNTDVNWVADGFVDTVGFTANIKTTGFAQVGIAKDTSFFLVGNLYAKVFGTVLVSSNDNTFLTGPVSATGLVAVTLTDANINGGAATAALAELVAAADKTADGTRVDITRLIFDDADPTGAGLPDINNVAASYSEFSPGPTAVPEASELALLALGAGGVLAHRRRRRKSA